MKLLNKKKSILGQMFCINRYGYRSARQSSLFAIKSGGLDRVFGCDSPNLVRNYILQFVAIVVFSISFLMTPVNALDSRSGAVGPEIEVSQLTGDHSRSTN